MKTLAVLSVICLGLWGVGGCDLVGHQRNQAEVDAALRCDEISPEAGQFNHRRAQAVVDSLSRVAQVSGQRQFFEACGSGLLYLEATTRYPTLKVGPGVSIRGNGGVLQFGPEEIGSQVATGTHQHLLSFTTGSDTTSIQAISIVFPQRYAHLEALAQALDPEKDGKVSSTYRSASSDGKTTWSGLTYLRKRTRLDSRPFVDKPPFIFEDVEITGALKACLQPDNKGENIFINTRIACSGYNINVSGGLMTFRGFRSEGFEMPGVSEEVGARFNAHNIYFGNYMHVDCQDSYFGNVGYRASTDRNAWTWRTTGSATSDVDPNGQTFDGCTFVGQMSTSPQIAFRAINSTFEDISMSIVGDAQFEGCTFSNGQLETGGWRSVSGPRSLRFEGGKLEGMTLRLYERTRSPNEIALDLQHVDLINSRIVAVSDGSTVRINGGTVTLEEEPLVSMRNDVRVTLMEVDIMANGSAEVFKFTNGGALSLGEGVHIVAPASPLVRAPGGGVVRLSGMGRLCEACATNCNACTVQVKEAGAVLEPGFVDSP